MRKLPVVLVFLLSFSCAGDRLRAQQPVQGIVKGRSTVNASIAIAIGNTFQTILAAPSNLDDGRKSLTIQNNNTADSCWIFVGSGTASTAKSVLLASGAAYTRYWPYVPNDLIQGTCASNGDTLYVDWQ